MLQNGKSIKTQNEALFLLRRAKKNSYFSQLRWQKGQILRTEAGALERSGDTNHPEAGLDGAEGMAILDPSGAARRLPGPKNRIFLKLALLISELLLGRPWAPGASLGLSWAPPSLLGCPRLPRSEETCPRQTATCCIQNPAIHRIVKAHSAS